MVGGDQPLVDLGAEAAGEALPAVAGGTGHGEEDLARKQAAAVVVRVQHPQGDAVAAARFEAAGAGVVVVEPVHGDAQLAGVLARFDALDFDFRLADQPEALVAGALALEVVGQQVGVHLRLEQGDARPVGFVDVLGGFRVELEGGEYHDGRARHQRLRFLQGAGYLALLQRRVVGAERDYRPLRVIGGAGFADAVRPGGVRARVALGVQPAGAGQRLDPREGDALAGLAADAGLQQLVAPIALPQRLAGARDRLVSRLRRRFQLVERLNGWRGDRLDGEGAGDARLAPVRFRLVVEDGLDGRLVVAQDSWRNGGDAAVAEP